MRSEAWILDRARLEEEEVAFVDGLVAQLELDGLELDFTVIGHAVNEVCRVESLCKDLGVPLLMTERFAAATGRTDARHLGARPLKGVTHAPSVVTLDRFAAL